MDENKNKIPKDGNDDHADHQKKDGSPPAVNEEPAVKKDEKKSSDEDLGNERMLSVIEQLERLEVTFKGRFMITKLREKSVLKDQKVKGSNGNVRITRKGKFIIIEIVETEMDQGGSSSNDHLRDFWKSRIGQKGLLSLEALGGEGEPLGDEDIMEMVSRAIMNSAAGNQESGSQGPVTQNGGSSDQDSVVPPPVIPMPRSGDQDTMEIASNANMNVAFGNQELGSQGAVTQKGNVFGPVTQKGGSSDQDSVVPPPVNPVPRNGEQDTMEMASNANMSIASGNQELGSQGPATQKGIVFGPLTHNGSQDNMEKKPNAIRSVRSGDDPHKGEASHGEESEDDMGVDRDAKRANK